eukprot:c1157_g1_i1.p1 GENE.c1157_g1_i1~~c1157_g1_i1.p1  ORF type:complete len:493 (-),score=118.28 c1157_g1_i1:137-1615(-)
MLGSNPMSLVTGKGDKRTVDGSDPHSKRVRVDSTPTKVVHFRNLPVDLTEMELVSTCQLFGVVIASFILRGKGQAFVEFDSETAAATFVAQFQVVPLTFRNQIAYVQLSQRKSVTFGEGTDKVGSETVSRVLLCSFSSIPGFPVVQTTADSLFLLFSRFGRCQRIIKFNKGSPRALVQFETATEASVAKTSLDGQTLSDGTTIRIGFSNLPELEIKNVSEFCKDFTTTPVAPGATALNLMSHLAFSRPPNMPNPFQMVGGMMHGMPHLAHTQPELMAAAMMPGMAPGVPMQSIVLVSGLPETVTPDNVFTLFGVYGDVIRVKILYNKRDCALVQFSNDQQAQLATMNLDGVTMFGHKLRVVPSNKTEVKLPRGDEQIVEQQLTKDYSGSPLHRFRVPGSRNFLNISSPTTFLHISNIPLNKTENDICAIFAERGAQVKEIGFIQVEGKTRKMALVTMETIESAVDALVRCDGLKIDDSTLRVNFSRPRRTQA